MDELQRAPRMTVDEILEHIRALPVRERLWLVERIIHELIADMPTGDEKTESARGTLEKR